MSEKLPDGWDTQATPPTSVEVADEFAGRASAATRRRHRAEDADGRDPGARRRDRPAAALAADAGSLAPEDGRRRERVGARARGGPALRQHDATADRHRSACRRRLPWRPRPRQDPVCPGGTRAQRALTPPELLRILATNPTPGTVLVVDDQIAIQAVKCLALAVCPIGKLVNAGVPVGAPTGGHLPFDGTGEIAGPLALRVTTGPNLDSSAPWSATACEWASRRPTS